MKTRVLFSILFAPILIIVDLTGQSIETVVQAGHYGNITAVCYSSDGNFIATGSTDKTVKLWRSSDGKEIRSYRGNSAGITHIEINRQRDAILSVSEDGILMIWELATSKLINQIKIDNDRLSYASFHPDGTRIITGSRKSYIAVWDYQSGIQVGSFRAVPVNLSGENAFDYPGAVSVAFSRDGQFVLAGTANYSSILWDAQTGKELKKFKRDKYTCITCLEEAIMTTDNKYVITSYRDSINVFDRATGEYVTSFHHQKGIPENIVISDNSHYIAAIEYGKAQVWDFRTGKLVFTTGDYSDKKTLAIALSPDGRKLITGNEKRMADEWDISTGSNLITLRGYLNQVDERILGHSSMYWAALTNEARLSPDGRLIAIGRSGNNAKLIDFQTGKVIKTLAGHNSMVISLVFSNDSKLLATGGLDGKAILWNTDTGVPVQTFSFPDNRLPIFSVDISADKSMLATADWGGYVVIWDIKTGKSLRAISPHNGTGCYKVKFSSSGVYFISAGLDGKLKLSEIDTGDEIRVFTGHTELVNSINWSPDNSRFITSGWDGTVRIWDFLSGLQLMKIRAHPGGVYYATYDQSGEYIVSGGDDFLIKLWKASTGMIVSEFPGHQGGVGDVNITADHKYIISGSRDGSIRTWSVEKEKELVSMVFMNESDWFIKNPEGYFDASDGAFSSISFVRGTELFAIDQFFNEFYKPGLYSLSLNGTGSVFRQNIIQTIDKFPPPLVEILSPENMSIFDNSVASFNVKVTHNGGGVKELKVMHNGKRQEVDGSDLRRMSKQGQYAIKSFDLALIPGENEISVSAFSDGEIESPQAVVTVSYKGLEKISNCYMISIGINKYANENLNLTYASPDAKAFAVFMKSKGNSLFNKINAYTFIDHDATKKNILAAIDEVSRNIKKEDVFVFFFAGHGSIADNMFYFITSEVTGLYQKDKLNEAICVSELQERIKKIPALKQVVFIDACHSGSSVDVLAFRGSTEEKALAQLSRSSGIHVLASSDRQQQSAEIQSLGHGVFTYVLLEALRGKADGAPVDSKVTLYEIKSYIDDQVPEISYRLIRHKQFPSTFSIGHDFPLMIY